MFEVYTDSTRPPFDVEGDEFSIEMGVLVIKKEGKVKAVFNHAFWSSFIAKE